MRRVGGRKRAQRVNPLELLSDEHLAQICSGLVQPAAQRRWLAKTGVPFFVAPNGRPIVRRSDFDARLDGVVPVLNTPTNSGAPNREALLTRLAAGRKKAQRPPP